MKKLIVILTFIGMYFVLKAEDKIIYSLAYSVNTTHINPFNDDYEFFDDNQVITLERELNKELIGITHFKNSFGNESMAVYVGKIYDKNNKGFYYGYTANLVKGYNKVEYLESKTVKNMYWEFNMPNVFYKDYSLSATAFVGYSFNKEVKLQCVLLGNAIVTNVKLSF